MPQFVLRLLAAALAGFALLGLAGEHLLSRTVRSAFVTEQLSDPRAGNAGLELLCSVAVDFVKIDRSVIAKAGHDPSALVVLEAVIAYAARTGATVIAEGIENLAQLALVREPGSADHPSHAIRGGQGFLLGRPAREFSPAAALR